MSKSPSHVTSTTNTTPWSGQQPYLLQGFQQAQNLLNQGGPQYYPGTTYASPNDYQYGGIQSLANLGLNATPVQQNAQSTASGMLSPDWLSANPSNPIYNLAAGGGLSATAGMFPEQMISSGLLSNQAGMPTLGYFASGAQNSAGNPYFQNMAQSTIANVLPAIQGQFNSGNRLDSGLASQAVGAGLGSAVGNLAYQNYQQGLQQQLEAAGQLGQFGQGNIQNMLNASGALNQQQQQNIANIFGGAQGLGQNFNTAAQNQIQQTALAPQTNNMSYQQAQALSDSGSQLQQLQQGAINDAVQRWNYNQELPYNTLNNYIAEIQGNYGGQTKSTEPYFQNQGANMLSGGLAGAGLASLFPETMGSIGGLLGMGGSGAGAVIGSLLSLI